MTSTLLYTIEEAFDISGRGCVLAPGIPESAKVPVRLGDQVRLLPPSGASFESVIHSLDAIHNRRADSPELRILVVLPKSVAKQDVPPGTQLFLLNSMNAQ
jgi:hypothetical protein